MKDFLHWKNPRKVGASLRQALKHILTLRKPRTARTKEEREWLDGKPVGRELI